MKKLLVTSLMLTLGIKVSYAQQTSESDLSENTINTRFFPTYNSDFSYYFLRKNMRLSEFLIGSEFNAFEDGSSNFKTKMFLPIFNSTKVTYDVPMYIEKYEFKDSNSAFRKNVYSVFGQSVLGLHLSDQWKFSHIIEFRFKGDGENLTKSTGNYLAQFITGRYIFNSNLSLTGGVLTGVGWSNKGQSNMDIKPAFMLTWKPNHKLSLMLGAPATGVEWSMPLGFDFVFHSLLDGDDINITTALRKNIGNKFDITGRFIREGYSHLNVQNNFVDVAGNAQTASFYYNKLQFELGLRPNKNTVIQLLGGYGIGRNLEIEDESAQKTKMKAADGLYFGISLNRSLQL
jgi:hypothetical protein